MYVVVVDSHGKHGLGMKDFLQFVLHDFQYHHAAHAFEASRGAAGTSAEEHADAQNDPGDVVPLGGIVVEHARGGDERDHLEQRVLESFAQRVVVVAEQEIANQGGDKKIVF